MKTVLASGNVLFTTPDAAAASKDKLEAALRKRFGTRRGCTCSRWMPCRRSSTRSPIERSADRHAYVVFILKPEVRDELLAVKLDPKVEQAKAGDGVVYWSVPKGDTLDSAMGKAQAAGKHKPWLTTRNLNTLEKLTR